MARVLLVGPPGAGKGTQAELLATRLDVPHIASGNLLRDARDRGTEVGLKVKGYIDRGELVPDDIVIEVVADNLADIDQFVLDGFPRTRAQAEALDKILASVGHPLDIVVLMDVDEQELIRRITGRRTCPKCQRPYHMTSNPPLDDETCDDDGTHLTTRPDDTTEKFQRRLEIYRQEKAELTAHYDLHSRLARINGMGTVEEVSDRIRKALDGSPA